MMNSRTPSHSQILVIGGGPAGSYTASALAREGFQVVLLEAAKFPRYHIGESLLPSIKPFLRFIDAEEKIEKHGFAMKPGAAVKFNQFKREGYTDFIEINPANAAYNVIRSQFDEIILRHAEESGAQVFEGHKVTEIGFDGNRPTYVYYQGPDGVKGRVSFDYLVDGSGRNGLMSTKYLNNRRMNASLQNIACWGYWTGAGSYMPGTNRSNAPWFEALTDESGWCWFIPLHDGTVSVGIVMNQAISIEKKRKAREAAGTMVYSLRDHYLDQLHLAPGLKRLLGDARLKEDSQYPAIRSATDYSYSALSYAGDHYRLVGDAAAFIDPFFSSGVHLALSSAFVAATSIAASIRGHCNETEASNFHHAKVGASYTRFLLVVMGAYKQIKAQNLPILSDVNEDNFDRAFDLIRPIIQGTADVDKKLSEDELRKTMEFVTHVFTSPTTPEMYKSVSSRVPMEYLCPEGKILLEEDINKVIAHGDAEAKYVLREVNARKPIHTMYDGPTHLATTPVDGMFGVAQRGALGIRFVA